MPRHKALQLPNAALLKGCGSSTAFLLLLRFARQRCHATLSCGIASVLHPQLLSDCPALLPCTMLCCIDALVLICQALPDCPTLLHWPHAARSINIHLLVDDTQSMAMYVGLTMQQNMQYAGFWIR